jgi:hypothetical protein
MNKKLVYRTLLAGLIVFVWQFASWAASPLHQSSQNHTPKQDSIMLFLNQLNLAEGGYFMPMPKPGSSPEEYEKFANESAGKPWAQLIYHKNNRNDMSLNMLRGLFVDFLLVLILFGLLDKIPAISIAQGVLYSCSIGLIGFIYEPYTHYIWYQQPGIWSYFLDALVPYALIGLLYAKFWRK